ncbi:MAG: hypothetical protein ABI967_00830 [bacterium]
MQNNFFRRCAFIAVLLTMVGVFLVDAGAQTRRKRRSRRARPVITNPAITPPATAETRDSNGAKIISTADESAQDTEQGTETQPKKGKTTSKRAVPEEDMQQTINSLSTQVDKLNTKLSQMQENDRSLLDMERLSRAELRAENLRTQQIDVESKLADLQSKRDEIEYALKPENIDRVTSGYGTTRPEEARDARRRQLGSEKSRLETQIRILETSRARLETAVANADAEVDVLRRRAQQQQLKEQDNGTTPQQDPQLAPKKP